MADGKSMTIVDGTFTRGGQPFVGAFYGPAWMAAKAHDAIAGLR